MILNLTNAIKNTFSNCGMYDLGFEGNMETWCNNQDIQRFISVRLDKFLASDGWKNIFPMYNNKHLPKEHSDHNPIYLTCHGPNNIKNTKRDRIRPKRFERLWTEHPMIGELIQNNWNGDHGDITNNLNYTFTSLLD